MLILVTTRFSVIFHSNTYRACGDIRFADSLHWNILKLKALLFAVGTNCQQQKQCTNVLELLVCLVNEFKMWLINVDKIQVFNLVNA